MFFLYIPQRKEKKMSFMCVGCLKVFNVFSCLIAFIGLTAKMSTTLKIVYF